jgi:hypothetical protein
LESHNTAPGVRRIAETKNGEEGNQLGQRDTSQVGTDKPSNSGSFVSVFEFFFGGCSFVVSLGAHHPPMCPRKAARLLVRADYSWFDVACLSI